MLIGCGGGQAIKVVKVSPPEALIAPREDPRPPEIPEKMTTGELLDWWEVYLESYREAYRKSENDKAAIRDWARDGREVK